jgi:predicted Zn finger-like uncharacterized protein
MARTITITCPHCDAQMKASPEKVGKKVRCKECDEVFRVEDEEEGRSPPPKKKPAPPPKKAAAPKKPEPKKPAPKKGDDDEDDPNPYGVTEEFLGARCPNCTFPMESDEAIVCLRCGYNTRTREINRTKRIKETTGNDWFLWLLPGILCLIGVVALIIFDVVYCVKADEWIDQNDWMTFWLASYGVKIWIVVASLFAIFYMGKYAFIRLLLENQPPEIEDKDKGKEKD